MNKQISSFNSSFLNIQDQITRITKNQKDAHHVINDLNIYLKFPPLTMEPMNYEDDIFEACETGNLKSVQWLLENEDDGDPEAIDDNNDTPIHVATEYDRIEIIEYLVEKQHVDTNYRGYKGRAPLHIACQRGYGKIVKYLISMDANVDAVDDDGNTPLHFAVINGQTDIMKYLIEHGANKNAKNRYGKTPFGR